jgi:hypothetical protein
VSLSTLSAGQHRPQFVMAANACAVAARPFSPAVMAAVYLRLYENLRTGTEDPA